MRIVFFSTCPANTYSGGRYHALIAAYCLARRGHDVTFITNNMPVFDKDLASISPENRVKIVLSDDFHVEAAERVHAVFIVPQLGRRHDLYSAAISLANRHSSALVLFCFESPNWFNAFAPIARPESGWAEWHLPLAAGSLVLCSAEESRRYADSYFSDRPPETIFDVWQPAINSIALASVEGEKERRRILMFVRPTDRHKGSDLLGQIMTRELMQYKFTIVIGKRRGSERFVTDMKVIAQERGITLDILYSLSDAEKFAAIKSSAVLVFPSYFEGYGYPPVEALACGTPCVAFDLPVIRENCGDLVSYVPVGDIAALKEKVSEVLSSPPSINTSDPAITFLADIDVRAEALENCITRYIDHKNSDKGIAVLDRPDPKFATSTPAVVRACGEVFGYFVLSVSRRIGSISVDSPDLDNCFVKPMFWHDGSWLHHVVMRIRPEVDFITVLQSSTLKVTFLDGTRADFHVDLHMTPEMKTPIYSQGKHVGITNISVSTQQASVFCWGFLNEEYDAALWLAQTNSRTILTAGTVGFPNPLKSTEGAKSARSGLLFELPVEALKADSHAVILFRDGSPVLIREISSEEIGAVAPRPVTELLSIQESPSDQTAEREGQAVSGFSILNPKMVTDADGVRIIAYTDLASQSGEISIWRVQEDSGVNGGQPADTHLLTFPLNSWDEEQEGAPACKKSLRSFSTFLPALENRTHYRVELRENGLVVDQVEKFDIVIGEGTGVPQIRMDVFQPSFGKDDNTAVAEVINTSRFIGDSERLIDFSDCPKSSISECYFDETEKRLDIKGWILSEHPALITVKDKTTGVIIASSTERCPGPGKSRQSGIEGSPDTHFELFIALQAPALAGYSIRFTMSNGYFERDLPNLAPRTTLGNDSGLMSASQGTLAARLAARLKRATVKKRKFFNNERHVRLGSAGPVIDPALPTELRISAAKYYPNEARLEVNGWCLTPDTDFTLQLSVPHAGLVETINSPAEEREDVFRRFPQYETLKSGWRVTLPVPATNPLEEVVRVTYRSDSRQLSFEIRITIVDPEIMVSVCSFNASNNILKIRGWFLSKDPALVTVTEKETGVIVASVTKSQPRPDVAERFGFEDFQEFGFESLTHILKFSPKGYVVRITQRGGYIEKEVESIQLAGIKEYKLLDYRYDEKWNIIWMSGSFVHPELCLRRVEVFQHNQKLVEGVVNIKQLRHGEPNSGWRFENTLPDNFDSTAPIQIRGTVCGSLNCRISTTIELREQPTSRYHQAMVALAKSGLEAATKEVFNFSEKSERLTALLIVHNLDAVERPEKVRAIESIEQELNLLGINLVILHHCQNQIPGEFHEINFFDGALDVLSEADWNNQLNNSDLAELRRELALKLYGFRSAAGRTPPNLDDCQDLVDEEMRKTSFVINRLKPDFILLWHQWNSLMEAARFIADAASIPSAFLHEGVLPQTLSLDRQGMMAESNCVGITLDAEVENASQLLDIAEDAIREIRENKLDRKPLMSLSASKAVRVRAQKMGAKVVFYAGVNDWHSGNLPRGRKGSLHSPHFEDTEDGLRALMKAAEENNWIVLFKPHPNLYPHMQDLGDRLVTLVESNSLDCILDSDVTVTILSSIAYIALANEKPVVLLGRNTLSGTQSVYEVSSRNGLGKAVSEALVAKDNQKHRKNFRSHVAALLRRHLYVYDPTNSVAILKHDALAREILKMMPGR